MEGKTKYTMNDIHPFINGEYEIKGDISKNFFTNLKPTLEAESESLVFVDHNHPDKQTLVDKTKANWILCDKNIEYKQEIHGNKILIMVAHPRLLFIKIGNSLFKKKQEYGIHPTAYIHPKSDIHKNSYIGPFSYIGKCVIGEHSIIWGNCYLNDGTVIGKNVNIDAGGIIGNKGFGYTRDINGEFVHFPQIGGVIIEDNVDVGANTCIDRGALKDTIIHQGTKINNLVHIAHNVNIGFRCLLNARVNISGSVIMGDDVVVGTGASIRDGVKIGNKAYIGMCSAVVKDIPEGITVVGVPAKPMK